MHLYIVFIFSCWILFIPSSWGQSDTILVDSTTTLKALKKTKLKSNADSTFLNYPLFSDSIASALFLPDTAVIFSKDTFDFPISYKSRDSLIYDITNGKVYMFGEAEVLYNDVDLDAYRIDLDWTQNTLSAETDKDSLNQTIGDVNFKDKAGEYKAKKIVYNFETKRGKVYQVRTQEGDGFVHAETIKRNENNEWYGAGGKYTTCDLEHPHYFISAKKMKVVPDKVVVSGPANLVIADIPTPLYVPFGIFPAKNDRTSGILFPQYGDEPNGRGFYLRNGGYYWHINDYMDATFTGDIYGNGSFAVRGATNYVKRYKYSGNFAVQFGRNKIGEKLLPDFAISKEFRVNWAHRQDAKARPGVSFGGQANFGSAGFDRSFSFSQAAVTNSSFNSNVSFSKTWQGKPFNFSVNASHAQSLVNRTVELNFPNMNFGISRINPFKSKNKPAKNKWYEDIGISYNGQFQNRLAAADSSFFERKTLEDAVFGFRHNVRANTSFKIFKYFSLNPEVNYNEFWHFRTVDKSFIREPIFDTQNSDSIIGFGRINTDTIYGFKSARDYSTSLSLTTIIYGTKQFKNSKIKAIRHVMTPLISMSFRPDFGKDRFGYYRFVETDTFINNAQRYSIFEANRGIPGAPSAGRLGNLNFSLSNILEMKVFSKKDTIKHERKIKIFDNLTISSAYNFAADSLKLSPVNISGRNTFLNGAISTFFSAAFDPYDTDSNFRKINTFMWDSRKQLTRFTNASFTLTGSIRSKNGTALNPTRGNKQEQDFVMNNLHEFYDFNIPWTLNFNFNFSVNKGTFSNPDTLIYSAATLSFDFDVNVTDNWKVNLVSGYNLANSEFSYTQLNVIRNLHCWELRFQFVPIPRQFVSYNIQINVKSPVLQELKLSRKQQFNNLSQF